jgi:16S rRNA (adenine1518-N6/adenine1519-N6)-dimethyltransferase
MFPRKRFGQHFLHEQSVIDRIVAAIDPKQDEHVVEIGPGLGAITLPLLQRCGTLDVVEIDRDAIRALRQKTESATSLRIHEADALQIDLHTISLKPRSLRVVGNLPYNISTPLLFHLLEQLDVIRDMHFMLQKEVVDRIVATPGNSVYGRLTVMLAPYVKADALFDIGPNAFRPSPKVTSTFFRLTPHVRAPFSIDDRARYARVVAAAFAQRRKTLRNSLRSLLTEADIRAAGVDPALRAEAIAPAGFAALAALLQTSAAAG